MSYTAELFLYHALDATSLLQFSTVSSSGPWTDARLTTPKTVRDAFVAWETIINAAITPDTVDLDWANSLGIVQVATTGPLWLRMPRTLADLLGFSVLVIGDGDSSDQTPLGIADVDAISWRLPREAEQSELREYRGGRATAYHRSRVRMLDVEILVKGALLDSLTHGSLLGGGKFRLSTSSSSPFDLTHLDGYQDVYPLQTKAVDRVEGDDDLAVIALVTTLEDPP